MTSPMLAARRLGAILHPFPAAVSAMTAVMMFNVSPVLPTIRGDLSISSLQAGLLLTANILAHTAMQIPAGRVVDAWGSRRTALLGLAVAATGTAGVALAPYFVFAFLARVLLGVGTGLCWLAGLVLAGEMAGPERGMAVRSLYGAMVNFGTLLALLATPLLAEPLGWRAAIGIEAALVFVLLGLGLRLVPAPAPVQPRRRRSAPWGVVLAQRSLYALGLAHLITYGTFTAVVAWAPTFLWQHYGLALPRAGALSAVMATGGLVVRVAGAGIPRKREVAAILVGCAATIGLTAVFPLGLPLGLTILVLLLLSGSSGLPFGAVFHRAGQSVGPEAAGAATGLVNFVANVGALLFPPLVGFLVDSTDSFLWGFWIVAGLAALGLAWAAPNLTPSPLHDDPGVRVR